MANKTNGVEEWVRAPPSEGSVCERIAKAIYNPQNGSFLGRTPKRWAILFAFYTVFYAVLSLIFAVCMGGLFFSLDEGRPTYTLNKSLIGSNPGVSHRPFGFPDTVVRYNIENDTYNELFVSQLKFFFTPYSTNELYTSQTECVAADNYGYPDAPCFFIKVNKIIDWTPQYFNVSSLPNNMPKDLTEYIHNLNPNEQKQIWVSCADEASNDTKIEYPWGRGLRSYFYPYQNSEGYISPVVAVKIVAAVRNTLLSIRCRAWAENIIYNKSIKDPSGYTRFQMYIGDDSNVNATNVLA